jgi:hypothetical protein
MVAIYYALDLGQVVVVIPVKQHRTSFFAHADGYLSARL